MELVLGYLDNFSLGGHQNQVARDVQQVNEVGDRMELSLNVNKCEVVADPATTITDPSLQSFEHIATQDASLLGALLFRDPNLDNAWAECYADLSTAVNRLSLISPQDALCLLRDSISAPWVHHLLQRSPSVDNAGLASFDELLHTALCRITNCDLTDTQWLQASLTIREHGLGVRQVACSSYFFSFSCKHPITPGRNPTQPLLSG